MQSAPLPHPPQEEKHRPTVLVVDDYPENCRLIYFYLRGEYEVVCSCTAEEALDILSSEPVDLVVMDINLKEGMNGIEAARHIREGENTRHIPVLAISAYAYPDDRARFLEAGFDDYIAKPIFKEAMLKKVDSLLSPPGGGVWISGPREV